MDNEEFNKIGEKLDKISQNIETLNLALKGLIMEFNNFNKNISENLSKITKLIIAYNENLNDKTKSDFNNVLNYLNDIEKNLINISKSPSSSLLEINNRLEIVLQIIGQLVDPDILESQLMKIKNYISEMK